MSADAESSPLQALPAGALARLFPFYIRTDGELRVVGTGPSLTKVLSGVVQGLPLADAFRLVRPEKPLVSETLLQDGSTLFLFESVDDGPKWRGQVFPLEDGEGFLMLCKPWFSEPDEIERHGLTMADFAGHDQTIDLLQILQSQRMANDDLKELAARLTEQRARLREKESEARKLALVAARTNDAVVVTDASGRIEWANEGFTRITEYTLEEAVGRKPGEILQGPETDPATVDKVREHIHRGEGVSVEILNYSKSGRKYWLAMEIQPIHSDTGEVVNFMAIERDITEAKEADRKLRETAALQLAMLSGAGYAIIAADPDGVIHLFNPAAERMLGYTAEEFVGKATPAVFHEPEEVVARAAELTAELGRKVEPGFEAFVAKARLGQPDQREWTYIRRDGTRLPVLLSVTALTDGGRIIGFLGIATDLTERKAAEQKVRTALSELERLNRVMMGREERVLELKREINAVCAKAGLDPKYSSVLD